MSLLKVEKVSKRFGGLMALSQVDLPLEQGQIKGLIGPNGSGKTTLFNVISGIYPLDAGRVVFKDQDLTSKPAPEVNRLGLARTFQEIQLFYDMTVLENAMVGCQRLSRAGVLGAFLQPRWVREEEKFIRQKAMECLAFVGLSDSERELARNIPYGHQRLLEVARALAGDPEVLLLDEPAAGMNFTEIRDLMSHIQKIQDRGVTVLLVEHNMKVVMDICERITVLHHGQVIAEGTPSEVQTNEHVIEAYLGRAHQPC
jgi:branched-chain amino acid transport system ATP-binding protein